MKTIKRYKLRESMEAYVMLLPMLLGLVVVSVGAIIGTGFISLTNFTFRWPPDFIGVKNYVNLFAHPLFPKVVFNSLYYVVLTAVPSVVLAFFMALILDTRIKGHVFFRVVYFWPVVTSMTAVALIWAFLFNNNFGLINFLLNRVGIAGPKWLADTRWALPTMAIIFIWKWVGYYMIILLSGLQSIPSDFYESATLDGAGFLQKTRHITLPLLSPSLFFVVTMIMIAAFQVFDQILVITKDGGPSYSTLTLSFYIFQNAFTFGKMAYASAMGMVLFVMVALMTYVQFKLQKIWVFYE